MVEDELLTAIADAEFDDPRFTDQEQAALRYTDTMWHDHRQMTPEKLRSMLDHFEPGEVVELGVMIAQFIGMGQLFAALGIPNPAPREV